MTVPRSVAEVLDGHVVFELECIDRMYLNLYQPKLMHTGGVVGYFKGHSDQPFASGALMDPMTKEFVAAIHRFIAEHDLDLVHFAKGQRKDDVAKAHLARHDGTEGVLFVGRAQEKASVRRNASSILVSQSTLPQFRAACSRGGGLRVGSVGKVGPQRDRLLGDICHPRQTAKSVAVPQ